ncbi:hypothetical protein K431DRAFT_322211 [Polychaeton citri CBS 116435]|uniref:MOSC domain-containing protein n=1 Tax=Polychaeton citri CBS 116435 TaxID=1314669 RepID=A0A9P4Q5E1_9PEZI|nr:hypothetical protein K431DRAFT_322211 [Polychaeton citri CBS 116435]
MFVYAQFTPDSEPEDTSLNAALGTASTPKNVNKDAPPIPPPTEVVALRIYPIKSCRGFEVDGTRLQKTGLLLDRNWMFIDKAKGVFMTIRQDSRMTLIDTAAVEEGKDVLLYVSVHGKPDTTVKVPAFPTDAWLKQNTKLTTVEIWETETDAWEYPEHINKPFSEFFGKDVALVYKGPSVRPMGVNGKKELYGKETSFNFADVMSYQVASQASIRDLNRRLKLKGDDALTIERFRPNIIVRGRDDKPWEEDTWKRIRISTRIDEEEMLYRIDMDVVARCARCQVPNTDPDTGVPDKDQPWTELMKFRRVDKGGAAKWKPCFGMLCIPKNEGYVHVGATVEVLETTDKHCYNTARFEDL